MEQRAGKRLQRAPIAVAYPRGINDAIDAAHAARMLSATQTRFA